MVEKLQITTHKDVDELACWLVLRRIPGLGPRRFSELLGLEKSLSNCFSGGQPSKDFLHWCQSKGIANFVPDWKGVEQDLQWRSQKDCHIITWRMPSYACQLKVIPQSPPVLFVKGQLGVLNQPQIAMVGTRNPTSEGSQNAFEFGLTLAEHGITITSGLALGIDGASHQGALAGKGCTIGVLGNGLDRIYPSRHQALAEQIVEQGALISEFPIGTPPKPENFPQRNRIISGLSLGVLVVEAALKSGSLITTNYALDQGREIFVLPGSIHNPMAKGNHELIRQGAKCIENIAHILEELPADSIDKMKQQHRKPIVCQEPKNPPQQACERGLFLTHIETVCTPIDTMIDRTGLSITEVSSMLLALEMEGKVISVPGGYVRVQR